MNYDKIREAADISFTDDELDLGLGVVSSFAVAEVIGLAGSRYLINCIRNGNKNPGLLGKLGCGAACLYFGTKIGTDLFNSFWGSSLDRRIKDNPEKYPTYYKKFFSNKMESDPQKCGAAFINFEEAAEKRKEEVVDESTESESAGES